jgi:RHS repeat-associated protein
VAHTNGSFANESFSYDTNGNRNSTGYGTGTDNRISTDGTYNYAFDNEGNLTTRTKISDSSQTIYKWDYHNRLTEVDSKPAVGATVVLATFTYDALDRRIGRTENGTATATLYEGNAPVLDFVNGSSTPGARYLQGLGAVVDQVLAREKSGTVAWYLPDRLGTIRDIVDNTGAIVDHVDYNAYGKVLSESVPSVGDRLTGFAGLDRDTATGLNLAVYRVQDPGTGRWLSEDPLGFDGEDTNLYRYLDNEPINGIDPSGIEWAYPWEDNANWRDWRLGEAIGDTISNIQVSTSVGVYGEAYLGPVHVQVSCGVAGGIDLKNGNTSIGAIGTIQGGQGLGIGFGGGVSGTVATTGDLGNLAGGSGAVGISTPVGGIDIGGSSPGGYGSVTGSIGPSVGGGVHIDQCYTVLKQKKFSLR